MADDYDGAWKEALERYFTDFMAFFLPQAHADIQWARGYVFLDQELGQIVQDAELGKRRVDKLVQVWRLDGAEAWVLIHIEIQSQHDTGFAERMYVYHYRIFDRYRRLVSSVAVLGDASLRWRPDHFGYALWDCQVDFRFPMIKLADYRSQWQALEGSSNPFATVVMAHLKTQETANDDRSRQAWKLALTRRLYRLGYRRDDVIQLYRFIDWLMQLPKALDHELWQTLAREEGEKKMAYLSYVERIGIEQGERQGLLAAIELGLELKFGAAGLALYPTLAQVTDNATLHTLVAALKQTATLDDLRSLAGA